MTPDPPSPPETKYPGRPPLRTITEAPATLAPLMKPEPAEAASAASKPAIRPPPPATTTTTTTAAARTDKLLAETSKAARKASDGNTSLVRALGLKIRARGDRPRPRRPRSGDAGSEGPAREGPGAGCRAAARETDRGAAGRGGHLHAHGRHVRSAGGPHGIRGTTRRRTCSFRSTPTRRPSPRISGRRNILSELHRFEGRDGRGVARERQLAEVDLRD